MADTSSTSAGVQKTDKIWLDGALIPWDEAKIHVMATGLHYGLGVFEGIRAYQTADGGAAVLRLREHVERLFDSARILLMEIPFTPKQVEAACLELLRANRMKSGYLRPIAFMGDGAMGLGAINPTRLAVIAWDWGRYLGEEGVARGIRAKVSSFVRSSPASLASRGKICGQYINSVLAKREAKLGGYDEAILLDQNGCVAEASGENLFLVRDGTVYTPPLSSPILEGITRNTIVRLLRDLGHEVREATFTRDTLWLADEVFLCGTAAEVTPVREVDDRRIGDGAVGPVAKAVQEAFFRMTRGEDPRYQQWLTRY